MVSVAALLSFIPLGPTMTSQTEGSCCAIVTCAPWPSDPRMNWIVYRPPATVLASLLLTHTLASVVQVPVIVSAVAAGLTTRASDASEIGLVGGAIPHPLVKAARTPRTRTEAPERRALLWIFRIFFLLSFFLRLEPS